MEKEELLKKVKDQTTEQIDAYKKISDEKAEEVKTELKGLITEASKGKMSDEDIQKKLDEISKNSQELTKVELEKIQKDVNAMSLAFEAFKETPQSKGDKKVSFKDQLRKGFEDAKLVTTVVENGETYTKVDFFARTGQPQTPIINIKAAVDMTYPNNLASVSDFSPFKNTYDTPVLLPISNDLHATDIFPVVPLRTNWMGLIVEFEYVDGSGTVAEGAASGKSSFKWKTTKVEARKNATHFRISEEELEDFEGLIDEISRLAPDKIKSSIDGKIFSDDNVAGDIIGLFTATNSTVFVPADFENSQPSATIFDAIRKMKLQATLTDYTPDYVLLHPKTIDVLNGMKDLNENSVELRYVKWDAMGIIAFIDGLRVVASRKVGENEALVGSSKASKLGIVRGMTIVIGLNGDDLTEGMRTVVISTRVAFGARAALANIYSNNLTAAVETINKS